MTTCSGRRGDEKRLPGRPTVAVAGPSEHSTAPGDAGSRLGSRLWVLERPCAQSHWPSQGPGRPAGTGFSQAARAGSPLKCGGPEGHAAGAVALTCLCHPHPASQWLFLEARGVLGSAPPAQPRHGRRPCPQETAVPGCAARTGAETRPHPRPTYDTESWGGGAERV